ncbi:MAG: response regulator transcription factor [Sphingomonadales bacterium]|nr:response regulator transcription factor [Sphingomonadales bacterium]
MQTPKTKVLVAEDDANLASSLKEGLELMGYRVSLAKTGTRALSMAETGQYPLLVLDLNLPEMSGMEVCRVLRKSKPAMPILMLTALGSVDQKIEGFAAGADDYMVKPPDLRELAARLRALIRRTEPIELPSEELKLANLTLDLNRKVAYRDKTEIALTAKEFNLLEYLMRNRGKVISRQQIAAAVWDIHFDTKTNVVDVYVNFLRKKIDRDFSPRLIHTQIGMGYRFDH